MEWMNQPLLRVIIIRNISRGTRRVTAERYLLAAG